MLHYRKRLNRYHYSHNMLIIYVSDLLRVSNEIKPHDIPSSFPVYSESEIQNQGSSSIHRVEQRLIHFVQSLPRRRKFVGEKREWAGCGQLRPLGCLAWLVTVWVCGSPVVPKAYYYFAGDCRVMKEQPRLASERRCLSVPSKKGGNEKDICCIWAIILSHLMSRKIVICNLLLFRPKKRRTAFIFEKARKLVRGGLAIQPRRS